MLKEFEWTTQWLQAALCDRACIPRIPSFSKMTIYLALLEIMVGVISSNFLPLAEREYGQFSGRLRQHPPHLSASAEVGPEVMKKKLKESVTIGVLSFFVPFLGVMAYAYYVAGWSLPEAQIAGIALSTTSVAVIYSVMIESDTIRQNSARSLSRPLSSPTLAQCWRWDPVCHYTRSMVFFIGIMAMTLFILPKFTPWFFKGREPYQ